MATIYRESDLDPTLIQARTVAIVGYGNQGEAHALNLRDSGVRVVVGSVPGRRSWAKAAEAGFETLTLSEATGAGDIVMLTLPDEAMAGVYEESIKPCLVHGQAILFAHGFNVRFGLIEPPAGVDVALVSPKGPGRKLRQRYLAGGGLAALVAVEQDASGRAHDLALSYAWGLGCARAGILESSFREETECDLFGEQAVLCGGIPALIQAGFETLVAAGYQPEVAYFECVHEAKLITDLIFERGLAGMRLAISDTAEWGGYQAGDALVDDDFRARLRAILEDVQSGRFAKGWIDEAQSGGEALRRRREREADSEIDRVAADLEDQMPGLVTS